MYRRTNSGLGLIRMDYVTTGACDNASSNGPTGNPGAKWLWMKAPDGSHACYAPDDPRIQEPAAAVFVSAPELPIAPKPTLPNPPATGGGTAATSGVIDSAMAWVTNNKLMAAGIAAGVVFLVVKK